MISNASLLHSQCTPYAQCSLKEQSLQLDMYESVKLEPEVADACPLALKLIRPPDNLAVGRFIAAVRVDYQ